MQDFKGVWVHLQSVRGVYFRQYCSSYKLLLKTICNMGIAHSAMDLYIYNANFDG